MTSSQPVSPGRRPGRARPSPREGALYEVVYRTTAVSVTPFHAEFRSDAPTQGRARPFSLSFLGRGK